MTRRWLFKVLIAAPLARLMPGIERQPVQLTAAPKLSSAFDRQLAAAVERYVRESYARRETVDVWREIYK